MVKLYSVLAFNLLVVNLIGTAQTIKAESSKCTDCKMNCLCKHFLDEYRLNPNPTKLNLITSNWGDAFNEDLEKDFPAPNGVQTISIKFDGMGCVYPGSDLLNGEVMQAFLDSQVNHRQIYKSSFYHLFNNYKFNETRPVQDFIRASLPDVAFQRNSKGNIELFEFTERWNDVYLNQLVKVINQSIKTKEKLTTIVIYVHGFNVPYSLAQIQGNELLKSALQASSGLQPENVLFLRVFWASGEYKHKDISASQCDYDNKEGPRTASAFTYVSNRTYLAGLYLRRILRNLEKRDVPVKIITHSHGATVATTALINCTTKFQRGKISKKMKPLIEREAFPDRVVSSFLNAPSIPGFSTFNDVRNTSPQNKYLYFVGYDSEDKVLKKQKVKLAKVQIDAITASSKLGSTTLGCNRHNEVFYTQKVMDAKGLRGNFVSGVNSFQQEHDFFCYMLQPEFKRNLKLFMNDQLFDK